MALTQKIATPNQIVDVDPIVFFEQTLKLQLDKVAVLVKEDDSILTRECEQLMNILPPFIVRLEYEDAKESTEPILKALTNPNYFKTGAGKKFTEESRKEIDQLIKLIEDFNIILQFDKKEPPEKDKSVKGWLGEMSKSE